MNIKNLENFSHDSAAVAGVIASLSLQISLLIIFFLNC